MSATNRGSVRVDQDAYQTPKWCVDLILKEIDFSSVSSFLEPCKGDGNIYNKIPEHVIKVYCEIKEGGDYLAAGKTFCDLTMTNPPFSLAIDFLQKSICETRKAVIYLLRLNFLGSQGRKDFWNWYKLSHLFVLSKRPAFIKICSDRKNCKATYPLDHSLPCILCGSKVKEGTDATEYAWFVWARDLSVIKRPPGTYVI